MTYFEDLSTYTYCDTDFVYLDGEALGYRPRYDRINIGWLDVGHPFETGPTPGWFADALLDILAGPAINTMRGFHRCSFCPSGATGSMLSVRHRSGAVWLGHREFRVPSGPGVMFAGPSLIWHYVTDHSYRPPAAFIEAVRTYDHDWTTAPSPWLPDDPDLATFT